MAVGVVIGGLFQFLIQVPGLRKQGMMMRPRVQADASRASKRSGGWPCRSCCSSSVNQLNIFISTIFASFLATGSITYLFYGMRFIHFPLGIFGIAIATAVLPTMSAQAARREMTEFRETLSLGLRLVFFIMFPAMAGLITLRVPIVNLLLEHGQFDRISTQGTAAAHPVLCRGALGLCRRADRGPGVLRAPGHANAGQDRRPCHGHEHPAEHHLFIWTPLAHGGLALATSLAAMLNIGLLTIQLRKKIGRMDGRRILRSLLKIIPASVAMGAIGWWVSRNPVWDCGGNTLYKTELLAGGMAVSVLFYIVAMWILKSEELKFIWGMVKRKTDGGNAECGMRNRGIKSAVFQTSLGWVGVAATEQGIMPDRPAEEG